MAGRKSKYETNVLPKLFLIECWARDGLIDEQIAKNLGISKDSLYTYKKKYIEFSDALKRGKEIVDCEVENALLQKALGITKTIMKAFKLKEVLYDDGKRVSEKEHIEYSEEEIYIPPDTTAQIFWLKNRKSAAWADKQEIEQTGDIKVTIKVV